MERDDFGARGWLRSLAEAIGWLAFGLVLIAMTSLAAAATWVFVFNAWTDGTPDHWDRVRPPMSVLLGNSPRPLFQLLVTAIVLRVAIVRRITARYGPSEQSGWRTTASAALIGIALHSWYLAAWVRIEDASLDASRTAVAWQSHGLTFLIPEFLTEALLVPLAGGLFMRHLLQRVLTVRLGATWAVLVTTALIGLAHLLFGLVDGSHDWRVAYFTVLALTTALAYQTWGLRASIAVEAGARAISILVSAFASSV